jgi:hypothetical protein
MASGTGSCGWFGPWGAVVGGAPWRGPAEAGSASVCGCFQGTDLKCIQAHTQFGPISLVRSATSAETSQKGSRRPDECGRHFMCGESRGPARRGGILAAAGKSTALRAERNGPVTSDRYQESHPCRATRPSYFIRTPICIVRRPHLHFN